MFLMNKNKTSLLAAIAALLLSNLSVVAVRLDVDCNGKAWGQNSRSCDTDCHGNQWSEESENCFDASVGDGLKENDNEKNVEGVVVISPTNDAEGVAVMATTTSSSASNFFGISSIAGTTALVAASMIY